MNISILIPNYNGGYLLQRNLPRVIEETKNDEIELIVVDDGSTDNSVFMLKNKFPQIKLIVKKQNEGFASTVNLGIKKAKGDIVVLLNNDVRPKKNFLASLLSHFKDKKVFAVGCLDESLENGTMMRRGRGIGKWQRGFLVHSRGNVDKTNTLWVSGGSGAFRRDLWLKLGGLDEDYNPFYWEDIDLSYRALKAGYRLVFESKSVVAHRHEVGVIKSRFSTHQIKRISFRNQFFFVWKNIHDWQLLLSHLFWLPYHLFRAVVTADSPFIFGFISALIKLPKILIKRLAVPSKSVFADKQILQRFENEA